MLVFIDNATPQQARNGRQYFSFWARILAGKDYISISGFKYFPDSKTISTPTQGKGDGKFVNLTKMNGGMYNAVLEAAVRTLGELDMSKSEAEDKAEEPAAAA